MASQAQDVNGRPSAARSTFHPLDVPRIRNLTGIRIHQLTLPDALQYASKLEPQQSHDHTPGQDHDGYSLGGPSTHGLSSSPDTISFFTRRGSNASRLSVTYAHVDEHRRTRSTSTSTIGPHSSPLAQRQRTGRSRAPTLAGEALEHAQLGGHDRGESTAEAEQIVKPRRIARCFIVLKLCDQSDPSSPTAGLPPGPKRHHSAEGSHLHTNVDPPRRRAVSRSSSTLSVNSPPTSPLSSKPPPPLGSSSPVRTRTASLNPSTRHPVSPPLHRTSSASSTPSERFPLHRSASGRSQLKRQNSLRTMEESPSPTQPVRPPRQFDTPFYISPIHRPSLYPRFLYMEPEIDFAPWLSSEDAAGTRFTLEVWYEDATDCSAGKEKWRRLEVRNHEIKLSELEQLVPGRQRRDNELELSFSNHPKSVFVLSLDTPDSSANGAQAPDASASPAKTDEQALPVERSKSQNRMRKGTGFGALHELVNVQAVITNTQREIDALQARIDGLLAKDVDCRAIKRDVSERLSRIARINDGIGAVERRTKEAEARVTLRTQALDTRRSNLRKASAQSEGMQAGISTMHSQIQDIEEECRSLFPVIHHWQSHHAQALDGLFPILPLDPSSLLYSILDVPLPIPTGAKDPAPPLSLPTSALPDGVSKIDERTTAAALGYAAMVVQLLGNLGGVEGGLPYPVTGAGSRSLVKDVVSVMQGPRSFPLYAKGVERYRYEYAVFLLNKNVETLMTQSNIRLLDIRHTLPNLKNLLLTLSSDVPMRPHPHAPSFSSSSAFDSRSTSRQTSNTWSLGQSTSPGSSAGRQSPGSSVKGNGGGLHGSPLSNPGFTRRSRLSRPSLSQSTRTEEVDGSVEDESDASETADEGENEKTMHGVRGVQRRAFGRV